MRSLLFAFIAFSCFPTGRVFAQTVAVARVSDIMIPVSGTIQFEDISRIKAPFFGRVETLSAEQETWVKAGTPLAYLADTKTAALLDYRGMTPKDVVLDRWKSVYSLTPIACSQDCLVIRRFVKQGQSLKPGDPLFKVAYRIALVSRVPEVYTYVVRNGQDLVYWPRSNPLKKNRIAVQNYVLDRSTAPERGVLTNFIEMRHYPQELHWSGFITLAQNVLAVPTSALVAYKGKVFLPMEVLAGVATKDLTEITAAGPLEETNPVLVLSDAQINKAFIYSPAEALKRMKKNIQTAAEPAPIMKKTPSHGDTVKKKPKGPSLWERLKNTEPLAPRGEERKSNSEDDNGD